MEREHDHDSPIDELRDAPVGTGDPNIVGDVGPIDIPPGQDPEGLVVHVDAAPEDVLAPEDAAELAASEEEAELDEEDAELQGIDPMAPPREPGP